MNRNEMLEEVSGFDSTEKARLRVRAERDLYVFCKGILGMDKLNTRLHKPLCVAVESDGVGDPDCDRIPKHGRFLRQMFLMSRGHLKSSVITIGDNLRRALIWPDHRILIGNEVYDNSTAFVNKIKQYLEMEKMIRLLWPERLPERTSGPGIEWSKTGLTLIRPGVHVEPTFFPIGTGGAVTSKHFTIINLDDVVGLKAFESPAEMQSAINWNQNIEPLIISHDETLIRWIGTRWMGGDVYEDIINSYGDELYMFHRTPYAPDGTIWFPEFFSEEFFERIARINPTRYAAQYMNDPTSGYVTDFEYPKIRDFQWDTRNRLVYHEEDGFATLDWQQDLDVVMIVDPNSGKKAAPDEAAISVTGFGAEPDRYVFSLENQAGRWSPKELEDKVIELYRKWKPRVIGVEDAGQQAVSIFHLEERFKVERLPAVIVPVSPENQKKEERIRKLLQPLIEEGRYFVPRHQAELRLMLKKFPGITMIDRLDAAAYCVKLGRTGSSEIERYRYKKVVREMIKQRNSITGY